MIPDNRGLSLVKIERQGEDRTETKVLPKWLIVVMAEWEVSQKWLSALGIIIERDAQKTNEDR